MKFTVTRKDDGNALIEMEAHRFDDGAPYDLSFTVSDGNAMMIRDAFNAAYPMEADDDWRKDGEWVEVSLKDAKPGDLAEFVRDSDEKTYRGTLSRVGGYLRIQPEDFDGPSIGLPWIIRCGDGSDGGDMTDLHIWRKLDPHRFDEPSEVGVYATQSGLLLYNDGDEPNWRRLDGRNWIHPTFSIFVRWDGMRKHLDDSEFPLVKVTPEMIRKAVES